MAATQTGHQLRIISKSWTGRITITASTMASLEGRADLEATLSALVFRPGGEGAAPNLFSEADYGRLIAALHRLDSMERF